MPSTSYAVILEELIYHPHLTVIFIFNHPPDKNLHSTARIVPHSDLKSTLTSRKDVNRAFGEVFQFRITE